MTNEQIIWNYLIKQGLNEYGVAGLMGNIYAESGLNPKNLQNTYEKKLGYTDDSYTVAVDNGSYTKFAKDSAGYGLCQWTYSTRKQNLLNYAKSQKKSIGDLEMQLSFLIQELKQNYSAVLSTLKTATSVKEASNVVLLKFEKPADQSTTAQNKRANYGQTYYDKYAIGKQEEVTQTMADYSKYINSKGTHYISNCGHDENGKYNGGKAGDQTGQEWELKAWYNRPWNYVYRYEKDARVGEMLAQLGCAAALNNNIGYDQYQRTTYWTQLKSVGYDPSKIKTPCEADCSCGVMSNVKATGCLLGISALANINYTCTTSTMRTALKNAGFTEYSASKYLTGGTYLLPGDILLKVSSHTATNITKGSKAVAVTERGEGDIPTFTGSSSSVLKKGSKGTAVKTLQENLIVLGYNVGKDGADGDFGANTETALKKFQADHNLTADGQYGPLTAAAMEKALNEKKSGTTATPSTGTSTTVVGTATAKATMHVRDQASASGKSLGVIQKGQSVEVVEIMSNGWYRIIWNNIYAYTSNSNGQYYTYIAKATSTSKKATEKPSEFNTALAGIYQTTGNINVRNGAGTNKSILTVIPKGINVTADGNYTTITGVKWMYVRFIYNNIEYTGYASEKYLKKL